MAKEADVNDVNFKYDPEVNYDEATMAQQKKIDEEVAGEQSLIGAVESSGSLLYEYSQGQPGQEVFHHKIERLNSRYHSIRRVRGDGNCFYRGFGFAFMEKLLSDKPALARFKTAVTEGKDMLIELEFPSFTIEDFHNVFMEVLDKLDAGCGLEELCGIYNDQGYSDYLVVFLRLLASGYLQKNHEFFANFVEGGRTVKEFCAQDVEPMGRESDHIHIIALTSCLNVPVRIEYLDQSGDGEDINAHTFPEGSEPSLYFLYKPGHYDILYK